MKRLSLLGGLFICALVLFTLSSCGEDPVTGPSANAPTLDLLDDGFGSITSDVDVAPDALLTFSVSALQGDSPLQNVRFLEDGSLITDFANRLTINGSSASSNSVLLFGTDKENFTWEVTWVAHSDESSKTYTMEVVDEAGNSDSESVLVNTGVIVTTPLSLMLLSANGGLVTDENVDADTYFKITLEGIKGSNDLNRIEIQEDGVAISDLSRLRLGDSPVDPSFPANPYFLEGDSINGFTMDILVKTHTTEGVAKAYSFILVDDQENFESVSLTITANTATPNITSLSGILLNRAGPTGGGLDLETGTSTGSTDPTADIRDAGIDLALPNDQNWKQKIEPVNGTILATPAAASDLINNFSSIQLQSEIENEYNLGTLITESNVINIGDVFLVNNGTNIFMIQCTNVNVTSADNADSYTFDVKF
ncbi:MAG: hypothetical protein ACI94Y_003281 [Maribacter sp.]|jgi:hypothetical protein